MKTIYKIIYKNQVTRRDWNLRSKSRTLIEMQFCKIKARSTPLKLCQMDRLLFGLTILRCLYQMRLATRGGRQGVSSAETNFQVERPLYDLSSCTMAVTSKAWRLMSGMNGSDLFLLIDLMYITNNLPENVLSREHPYLFS